MITAFMLTNLLELDKTVFLFLNGHIRNPAFDMIMPFVTNLNNWKIPIVLFWLFLIIKGGKRGRVAAFLIVPVLILTDQVSASYLKPLVARLRPCHALSDVRLLVNCGGKYAFPSSHATNIAGFATLFTLIYRKYWYWFWSIALLIGFSRIYVGVHYPGDVLGGFLIGATLALIVYYLYRFLGRYYPAIRIEGAINHERENP